MQECMFCRSGDDEQIFNVFLSYGNSSHTVKDDMIEFLGENVEVYFTSDDAVCYGCKNTFDNIAKLKRRVWRFISKYSNNANVEIEPISLGRFGQIFAALATDEELDSEALLNLELVEATYSTPYKHQYEKQFEERERTRSLSRSSYLSRFGRSDDSISGELETPKKKRRRRKRCYSTTPYKRKKKTEDLHHENRPRIPRSISSMSHRNKLYDDSGRLMQKRTRSVSRLQEEVEDLSDRETTTFYCGVEDCTMNFVDMDVLTFHKTVVHKTCALFFCDECDLKYTTRDHLKIHNRTHDIVPVSCFMCGSEFKTREKLQEHLNEHMKSSIPCLYCDKSFLSESKCIEHVKNRHSGRREKTYCKPKSFIKDRIDKETKKRRNTKPTKGKKYQALDLSSEDQNCRAKYRCSPTL